MASDDPRAPYKVYQGDECKGTYPTRAEARRAQQRLAEAQPQHNFIIFDVMIGRQPRQLALHHTHFSPA
jgi:hypothetical protein